MPGLTPTSSPLKSSREQVGTKGEGTAQPRAWVMDLDPTACSPAPAPWPGPSDLPQAVAIFSSNFLFPALKPS